MKKKTNNLLNLKKTAKYLKNFNYIDSIDLSIIGIGKNHHLSIFFKQLNQATQGTFFCSIALLFSLINFGFSLYSTFKFRKNSAKSHIQLLGNGLHAFIMLAGVLGLIISGSFFITTATILFACAELIDCIKNFGVFLLNAYKLFENYHLPDSKKFHLHKLKISSINLLTSLSVLFVMICFIIFPHLSIPTFFTGTVVTIGTLAFSYLNISIIASMIISILSFIVSIKLAKECPQVVGKENLEQKLFLDDEKKYDLVGGDNDKIENQGDHVSILSPSLKRNLEDSIEENMNFFTSCSLPGISPILLRVIRKNSVLYDLFGENCLKLECEIQNFENFQSKKIGSFSGYAILEFLYGTKYTSPSKILQQFQQVKSNFPNIMLDKDGKKYSLIELLENLFQQAINLQILTYPCSIKIKSHSWFGFPKLPQQAGDNLKTSVSINKIKSRSL